MAWNAVGTPGTVSVAATGVACTTSLSALSPAPLRVSTAYVYVVPLTAVESEKFSWLLPPTKAMVPPLALRKTR